MLSEKIVVVDDEPRIIMSIKISLEEYEIVDFANGDDALAYLRSPNAIKLVIVDVMMPGKNGIAVLQEIKEIREDIAVIIMTAYGSKDVVLNALRSRADDFIEKPFNVEDLREKVRRILRVADQYAQDGDGRKDCVARIKRLVDRNHKKASLDFVAEEMCLSPKYLSRLFNEYNEMTFRDYKISVKIQKACELLERSSYPVTDISYQLGYQNPESFMRLFKRETKMTPSEYRRKKQQQP